MSLSGKEKAQLLLSLLGDKSKAVLTHLSAESAALLTETIEEAPQVDKKTTQSLLQEVIKQVKSLKEETPSEGSPEENSGSLMQEEDTGSLFGSSEPEQEPVGPPNPELRSPEEIAHFLSEQTPQFTAFILKKIDDAALKESILEALPESLKEEVDQVELDNIPISDSVYLRIYDTVFKKQPNEEESESSNSSESFFS